MGQDRTAWVLWIVTAFVFGFTYLHNIVTYGVITTGGPGEIIGLILSGFTLGYCFRGFRLQSRPNRYDRQLQ